MSGQTLDFERFNKEITFLMNFFKKESFHRDPTSYEKTLYAKLLSYILELDIITSRLEEGIAHYYRVSAEFSHFLKHRKTTSEDVPKRLVMALATIMLDLSDFYIYTRIFLDAITISIKHSFRSAGNENWELMKNSISSLLKPEQLKKYKENIDFKFFEGLEKKITWIHDLKKSRDRIIHLRSHLGLSTTIDGRLGYDIVDVGDESWGRDTVREIFKGAQDVIDNISDLMKYLSDNLPRTHTRGKRHKSVQKSTERSTSIYMLKLRFPGFSKNNVLRAARTLSEKPIILNGRKLPYPSNMVNFAEYNEETDEIQMIVVSKEKEVQEIYEKGKQLYATAAMSKNPPAVLPQLLNFAELILSTEPIKSGCKTDLSKVTDLDTAVRMLP